MKMEVDESVIDERMDEARTCTNVEIEFPEHPYHIHPMKDLEGN
jgi:hypothetical protein